MPTTIPPVLMRVAARKIQPGETFYMVPLGSKKLRAWRAFRGRFGDLGGTRLDRPGDSCFLSPNTTVLVPLSLDRHI